MFSSSRSQTLRRELNPVDSELNPSIVLNRVSTDGYSSGDLNSYYSGTVLACMLPEKGCYPFYVEGYSGGSFVGRILNKGFLNEGGSTTSGTALPPDNLYRFTPPCGYYIVPNMLREAGPDVVLMKLNSHPGGYKKSFNPRNFSLTEIQSRSLPRNILGGTKPALVGSMYILHNIKEYKDLKVFSPRLALNGKELISGIRDFRVGAVKDGVLTTCFEPLLERIREAVGEDSGLDFQIVSKPTGDQHA